MVYMEYMEYMDYVIVSLILGGPLPNAHPRIKGAADLLTGIVICGFARVAINLNNEIPLPQLLRRRLCSREEP